MDGRGKGCDIVNWRNRLARLSALSGTVVPMRRQISLIFRFEA
jgi:hypothetical protein